MPRGRRAKEAAAAKKVAAGEATVAEREAAAVAQEAAPREIAAKEAGAAGEAAVGGPGSWCLMQQEADEAQEVKVFGAFISPGLFEGCGMYGMHFERRHLKSHHERHWAWRAKWCTWRAATNVAGGR